MKFAQILNSKPVAVAAGVAVAAVALYLVGKKLFDKAGDAAGAVVDAVNPASDKNLAYRATSSVIETLSGGRFYSLGDLIYGAKHGEISASIFGQRDAVDQNASNKPYQRAASPKVALAAARSPIQPDQKETVYVRH